MTAPENYLNMPGITKENIWFFVGHISSSVPTEAWNEAVKAANEEATK